MKKKFLSFMLFFPLFICSSWALKNQEKEDLVTQELVKKFFEIKQQSQSDHSWPIYLYTFNHWYKQILTKYDQKSMDLPHPLYHLYGAIENTSFYSKIVIKFSLALAQTGLDVFYIGPFSLTPKQLIKTISIQTKVPMDSRFSNTTNLCRPWERTKEMMLLGEKMAIELENYISTLPERKTLYKNILVSEWNFDNALLFEFFLSAINSMPNRETTPKMATFVSFIHDHIYEDRLFSIALESMKLVLLNKNYKVTLVGPGYKNAHHMSNVRRLYLFRLSA